MASLADVFKDKERTNWLKAWLAIDIAKSGLEHLADNEAQEFHRLIYSRVGSTCNSCSTKKLMRHKPCPRNSCDKVYQEIIKEHRYNSLSWKNTSGHLWHKNYWEIAKCYFPPDGYDAKSSIHETDINGVVSFMLNCTRFDSKFSFPITKGKPKTHNATCLLYEAREIGKAVRHSSVMKVTDLELQDYFTTLSDLLNDSRYLSGDSDAQNAVKNLAELKKDTLLLTTAEMMCLLEAADATLKQHLKDVAKDAVNESANDLRVNATSCIDEIKDYMNKCKQELTNHADMHKHDIMEQTDAGKQEIKEHINTGKQEVKEHIDTGKHEIKEHIDTGKHEIKEQTDTGKQEIKEHIDTGKHEVKEHIDTGKNEIKEHIDTGKHEIKEHTDKGKQEIKEQIDIGKQEVKEHIDTGKQEIKEQTDLSKQEIQEYMDTGKQDFDEHANKRIRDFNEQFENTGFNETSYKQSCEGNVDYTIQAEE